MSAVNLRFFRNLLTRTSSGHQQPVEAPASMIRVLMIEQNINDRKALTELLHAGFDVVEFDDEIEALGYVKTNTIDIALINDSLFHNINAGRMLYSLRENSQSQFRAFALTSNYSESQILYLKTAGFEQVLCKPINGNELHDLVFFNKIVA
jgi:DNA-binding response OmpR family regulator